MSRTRNLEVLARLRRMELDQTKRSLADTSRAILVVEESALAVWREVTIPTEDIDKTRALHLRGAAVETARVRSECIQAELDQLRLSRRRLEEQARHELLSCRQLEIVVGKQSARQTRLKLQQQQQRSDELATQAVSSDG